MVDPKGPHVRPGTEGQKDDSGMEERPVGEG